VFWHPQIFNVTTLHNLLRGASHNPTDADTPCSDDQGWLKAVSLVQRLGNMVIGDIEHPIATVISCTMAQATAGFFPAPPPPVTLLALAVQAEYLPLLQHLLTLCRLLNKPATSFQSHAQAHVMGAILACKHDILVIASAGMWVFPPSVRPSATRPLTAGC
jgi:hypothetical protein